MKIIIKNKEQFIEEIKKIEIKEFMCGDVDFQMDNYILTMSFECYGLKKSAREDISNCKECVRGDECLKKKNCDFYLTWGVRKHEGDKELHIYRNKKGMTPGEIEDPIFLEKIYRDSLAKILGDKIINNEQV